MDTNRKVRQLLPASISLPDVLKDRNGEPVLRPVEDEERWIPTFHSRWIGRWHGEPLVRPEQGNPEMRNPFS